jgi:hypothetical protein
MTRLGEAGVEVDLRPGSMSYSPEDPTVTADGESRAYQAEVNYANSIGEPGIADQLLQEVSGMIRAQKNRQLMTVGTTSVSQLGAAGLIAGGSKKAIDLAAELVQEWHRDKQSDFAWLMKSSGIAWPAVGLAGRSRRTTLHQPRTSFPWASSSQA